MLGLGHVSRGVVTYHWGFGARTECSWDTYDEASSEFLGQVHLGIWCSLSKRNTGNAVSDFDHFDVFNVKFEWINSMRVR
jgi:hypothetical protein